jgi:hypothetical protein
VRVALTIDTDSGLRSGASGVLTALACVPGAEALSGTSSFAVDGVAVIDLATAVPLWRPLEVGDHGPDVAALETELGRLGAAPAADGEWDWADARAFDALFGPFGVETSNDGTVPVASLAWLPAPSVVVGSCPLAVGAPIGTAQIALGFAPRITLARVQPPPDFVQGPRVLVVDGATIPVPVAGAITDPAGLAALAASPQFASADGDEITLSWALASAVDVTVLPPSALYDLAGDLGCVEEERGPTAVTVIASQLGRTLVEPGHRLGLVAVHPGGEAPCR